jgi:hypothetical protein
VVLRKALTLPTRKEQALYLKQFSHAPVAFAKLDGKPYEHLLWKMVKP